VEPDSVREAFSGKLIRVEVESWPAGEREVVRHPGACAGVAVTEQDQVVLVRQRREAVRDVLVEIPAGIYDVKGEDPAACATREVTEETGYRVVSVEPLASIHTSPGFTDERIDLFVVRVLADGAPEAGVEVVLMSADEARDAIRDGRIADAKTVAGLLLAFDHLGW
jgi:ADP-ribose diphosphatase